MSTYFCDLLTVADLARLLRRKPQGVSRDASRRLETLPPFIRAGKTPLSLATNSLFVCRDGSQVFGTPSSRGSAFWLGNFNIAFPVCVVMQSFA